MMDAFRTFGQSRASKWLLTILVVCFAAWGIESWLVNTMGHAALTINGEDIPLREVDQTYRNRTATITQMMGGHPPTPDVLRQLNVPDMVLTEVINRTVLRQAAHDMGLAPSKRRLREEITTNPAFQTDGKFDAKRYQQLVGQMGFSTSSFEKILAADAGVKMLAATIKVGPVPAKPFARMFSDDTTTFTLDTFVLAPSTLTDKVPLPTDAEAAAFYQANQEAYRTPERRSFKVLTLDAARVAASIVVPDDQITAQYEANKANYMKPETRRVRHILVKDVKEAVVLHKQITDAASFAALAKQHSLDPGSKAEGGDLGDIAEADVVPTFAKVAFSQPVGQVSEPVQSPFGWHLIWVESVTPAAAFTLADVKDRIRKDLVTEQTENALQDILRTVDDRAAGGAKLTEIAHDKGLSVTTQTLLPPTANTVDEALVQAAFAAEQGRIEGPITLKDGSLAYVEVTDIQPSAIPSFASMKDVAKADLRAAKIQTSLEANAKALITNATQTNNVGKALADIARTIQINGEPVRVSIDDVAKAPAWTHTVMNDIYALPADGVVTRPILDNGKYIVARVAARTVKKMSEADMADAAKLYRANLQTDVETLTIQHLVASAKVKPNVPVLRQVFGADWTPRP